MLEDILIRYFAYLDARHWASRAETTPCQSSACSTMRGGRSDARHKGDLPVENNKVSVGQPVEAERLVLLFGYLTHANVASDQS